MSSSSSVASATYSLANSTFRHQNFNVERHKKLLHDESHEPKTRGSLGLLVVGLSGPLGTALVASLLANQSSRTWFGPVGQERSPNYEGCQTQMKGKSEAINLANANLAAIGGWDIRSIPLGDALLEAQILDYDLVRQIRDEMNAKKVFRGYSSEGGEYILDERDGSTIADVLKCLRADIRYFKWRNGVVGHTTMLYTPSIVGEEDVPIYETARDLLQAFEDYENYDSIVIPTWIVYATAALLEGCSFVCLQGGNSTNCPALYDLAQQQVGVYIFIGKNSDSPVDNQLSNLVSKYLQESLGKSPLKTATMDQPHDNLTMTTIYQGFGFMNQPYTVQTKTTTTNLIFTIPKVIDIAVWCDFFSGCSWSLGQVMNALQESYDLNATAPKRHQPPNSNNDSEKESLLPIWLEARAAIKSKQQQSGNDEDEENRTFNCHPSFITSSARSTPSSNNKKRTCSHSSSPRTFVQYRMGHSSSSNNLRWFGLY